MKERWVLAAAVAAFLAAGGAAAAAEEEDSPAARMEVLVDLLQAVASNASDETPSVLAGIDPERAPAGSKRIVRVLRENHVDLVLEKASVRDTVEILRQTSGLNFVITPKAAKALEEEKAAVTVSFRDIPLESALDLLAIHLGEYRFGIRYNAIVLMRREEYRPRKFLRIYDVTDIIRKRTDFVAPPMALSAPGEKDR